MLTGEKLVEQRKLFAGDGIAIGTGREEVVGVHRDEEGRVFVICGDLLHCTLANCEVVYEVDLFEGGVFADQFA